MSVRSLKEFVEIIQDNRKDNLYYFYRGQCGTYNPLPSAFRANYMGLEDILYHELILRCPDCFRGLSHLDTLVMMQHYGLPTRLLDVTTNPLVALYFACKDYSKSHKGNKGQVFIYEVSDDKVVYSDSDRVLMLSCLPIFSLKEKNKIYKACKDGLESESIKKNEDKKYIASVERLFHEIAKEIPAFKREIKPNDLLTPLVVKPKRSNDRILKQDGAFIISGLSDGIEEAENKIQSMCAKVLDIDNKDVILKELDDFGINEASLFPEVDKVAEYLKDRYNAK